MKNILVPFNFSAAAFNAVHHAIQIAQRSGASITFLCNGQAADWLDDSSEGWETSQLGQPHPSRQLFIGQLLKYIIEAAGSNEKTVAVDYRLDSSSALSEVLRDKPFDLVILGQEKEKGLVPVDDRVLAWIRPDSPPMLFIPLNAPFRGLGNLAFVSDQLDIRSGRGLNTLFQLTAAFQARLHILCIRQQERSEYYFRQLMKQLGLAHELDSIYHTYHLLLGPNGGEAFEVERFVQENELDWLVSTQEQFISLPKQFPVQEIARRAGLPLLVLPASDWDWSAPGKSTSFLEGKGEQ